jgi:VWFA-related protein
MGFRFSTSAVIALALLLSPLSSQTPNSASNSDPGWIATIQVQVRDGNGHPVTGLEPANFIVTEDGNSDPVISVQSFEELTSAAPAPQIEIPNQQPSPQPKLSQSAHTTTQSTRPTTWILLILAPMSAAGRNASITGVLKFLNQPHPADWSFSLFDDARQLLPFGNDVNAIRARLNSLAHKVSPPQFDDGPWVPLATRAIAELGTRPGRRAVIFASDYDSDAFISGLHRLRVGPSGFVDAAIRAQAPMYTLQASGPGVVVPFGGAADISWNDPLSQTPISGQFIAEWLNSDFISLGQEFSEFLWSAYETGGRPARTMQDAFERIAEDAGGLYRITFRPQLLEADGSWRPVSVEVRSPRAHAKYATYYVAPTAENRVEIPQAIRAALKEGANTSGLDAAAHVWIFPAVDGVSTTVMTADITWPGNAHPVAPRSKLQIYTQIINENIGQVVGSWLSEREWNSPTIHWQREVPLYPGSYNLRVYALDPASKRIATRAFSFTADPFGGARVIRISPTVIANRCLRDEEIEGRQNLFDPLLFDGCLLAPTASATFSLRDKPLVLVRFYAHERNLESTTFKHWKAFASVGEGPLIPLTIAPGNVRGFIASGRLDLEKLNLKPGTYIVNVGFDIGEKEPVFARPTQLTIAP